MSRETSDTEFDRNVAAATRDVPPAIGGYWLSARELTTILFCGFALSYGWGVRGHWGHEFGAMIPGALAAMAGVLSLGRDDWQRRIPYFAFLGALGWSFGGSISYMWVIGYAHSGHAPTVLYGFACLFVIGFLWGSLGGLGTALPACLDRQRLTELLIPSCAVFIAWYLQAILMGIGEQDEAVLSNDYGPAVAQFLKGMHFNWFDTDWVAALTAAAAVLILALIRRRLDWGSRFILALAAGWWIGFTVLTPALGLRMTPNRGDSWAGMLGMVTAAFVFLLSNRLYAVAWSTLVVGLIGGLGFSGATLFELFELKTGYKTNWHSVLEQTYGFINGLGVGVAMVYLARRTPRVSDEPAERRWTETFCVFFVLVVITWLNIRKNLPKLWIPQKAMPEEVLGLSSAVWFELAYLVLAAAVLGSLLYHRHVRRIDILPDSWLRRGQLFFLVFLWWINLGNISRYLAIESPFTPPETAINLNAGLLTLFALVVPKTGRSGTYEPSFDWLQAFKRTLGWGLTACAVVVLLEFAITRATWGDTYSGFGKPHIRFGPNSTTGKYPP